MNHVKLGIDRPQQGCTRPQQHQLEMVVQSKADGEVRKRLEETADQLNADVLSLQQRAQDAEAAQQGMVDDHNKAMQEMQQATAEGRHACTQLTDAQERAAASFASADRAQQVPKPPRL
jgi:hypothetical protein